MATATKKRKNSKVINLREDLALGLAPLSNGQKRVDRDKKIIYGVKLLGGSSQNSHGVDDVEGTDYEYDAVCRAAALYEGLKGNANHPPREAPNQERSVYDRVCKYFNVRPERSKTNPALGELFADLVLIPSHPLTEALLDAAENEQLNDCFSLSHNARGRGEVRGGRYVITEITEARSVDIVADGGSTRSLYESRNTMADKKTTLGKIILESKIDTKLPSGKTVKAWLLEMDDLMGAEVPMEPEGDHKDDLVAAVAKLLKSDDPKDHELVAKITALLAPEKADELTEPDDADADDKKDEKAMKESCMKESKELFKIAGVKEEVALLEACSRLPETKDRIAFVNGLKSIVPASGTVQGKRPPGNPRDASTGTKTLQEQKVNTDDLLTIPLN